MPTSIVLVEQVEPVKAVFVLHSIQGNSNLCLKESKEWPRLNSKKSVLLSPQTSLNQAQEIS